MQRQNLSAFAAPLLDLRIEPFFSDHAYFKELADADAVLLPYDPQEYRLKNSNIVSEALCCGTPVVLPSGKNSLAEFVENLDSPCFVAMRNYSGEGLHQAMEACASQLVALKKAARSISGVVRQSKSPDEFLCRMLTYPDSPFVEP